MIEIFIFLSVVLLSILLIPYFSKVIKTWNLPGPHYLPFIGSGFSLISLRPEVLLQGIGSDLREYNNILKIWLGLVLVCVVGDPKDVEIILSSQKFIEKSDEYTFLWPWLGQGLLVSNSKKWFSRRRAITPTFHFKILEQFVDVFEKQGNIFISRLKKYAQSHETFDLYPHVTLCALDVICESAMGTTANAQINAESEYVRAVKDLAHIIHIRSYDFLLRYELFFRLSPKYYQQQKALKILHGFTDSVIVQRREELLKNNNNEHTKQDEQNDESDIGIKKKMAFLDVLLQSTIDGQPLSNMDIREEVDTFMFEGHDTTTSAVCFALYNIAKYPEVQNKIVEEIKSVLNGDSSFSLTQLNEMHYTELVIKETLRLYPSVPLYGRKIKEDTDLNGKLIPAGTNLIIAAFFMGRDPEIFPDPEAFKPERFDVVTNAEKSNPYSYIPFSAGSRNCIGQKFALLELKSLITKVLIHYEIELPENHTEPLLVAELVLRPQNGIPIKIKPRTI